MEANENDVTYWGNYIIHYWVISRQKTGPGFQLNPLVGYLMSCPWMFIKYLQYSLFGSILTVGAMIGASMSGRISDLIGRRAVNFILLSYITKGKIHIFVELVNNLHLNQTMGFSEMFCSLGWLTIYLSKVSSSLTLFKMYVKKKIYMLFLYNQVAIWLDIGRFLVGYGMGILSFVVKYINHSKLINE